MYRVEEIFELDAEEKIFGLDVIILPAELKQRFLPDSILDRNTVRPGGQGSDISPLTSSPVNQFPELHTTMLPSKSDRHSAAFSMK